MTAPRTAPRTLGLVADDFTGAADSAGVFARHGWSVRLRVDARSAAPPLAPGAVLASVTEARPMTPRAAAQATDDAVREAIDAGADRLFVKIDSSVRGSVAAQVEGALRAWRRAHPLARAVVAPSFPALGRTVVDGVVRVDGIAVAETASGRDPFTPVLSSRLADLLPGFEPLDSLRATLIPGPGVYADAVVDRDLDAVAAYLEHDPALVAIGSAGLASALARRWRRLDRPIPPRRPAKAVLVAVSSLHPVTALQVWALRAASLDGVEIVTTPRERGPSAESAAAALADAVGARLRTGRFDALISVGGDGVAAVLRAVDATAVDIDGVLQAGCPTGVLRDGIADGTRVVTKSGGFGPPDVLVVLATSLLTGEPTIDPPFSGAIAKEEDNV